MLPFWNFENGIKDILESVNGNLPTTIELLINVDELPISRSSCSQFWPILGSLSYTINKSPVFPVGIFHGTKKPSDAAQYLSYFVDEINNLQLSGLKYQNSTINVLLKGIICDSPARAFILNIKTHNGYNSCSKCVQEGMYINNRICFPETCCPLRTYEDFRQLKDEGHHLGTSPLINIRSFGCVTQVPYEYMHLVCLGVMKKLAIIWTKMKPQKRQTSQYMPNWSNKRLSPSQKLQVSNALDNLKPHISVEFCRKPRSFGEVDRWKATEFRQFLLYTGPVVLKNILQKDVYLHFLVLHCAIRIILNCDKHEDLLDYAQSLLICFVIEFSTLYVKELVSYNVHGLLHMCEDVKNFGSLDFYSSFQFENYMQKIKRSLRKAEKSLAQIVCRTFEKRNLPIEKMFESSLKLFKEHFVGPLLSNFQVDHQYEKMNYKNFKFSINRPNNICILHKGDVIEIENIILKNDSSYIFGKKFIKGRDFFTKPCPSSLLGISFIKEKDYKLSFWSVNSIMTKCLLLPYESGFVVMPLCGTDE